MLNTDLLYFNHLQIYTVMFLHKRIIFRPIFRIKSHVLNPALTLCGSVLLIKILTFSEYCFLESVMETFM